MSRRTRFYTVAILIVVSLTWLGVLLRQHYLVDKVLREVSSKGFTPDSTLTTTLRSQPQKLPSVLSNQDQKLSSSTARELPIKSNFTTLAKPNEARLYFNQYPLTLVNEPPPRSTSECVDESLPQFQNISWQFTSCHYTNLCFNTQSNQYTLERHGEISANGAAAAISVALGGINPRWDVGSGFDRGSYKIKWAPETIDQASSTIQKYYQLPENVVLVPFHSFAGHNVGHLLWDDFLAIFRLLQLHGLFDNSADTTSTSAKMEILPIRQVLEEKLYATCDIRRNKRLQCMNHFSKFVPLMGVDPMHFSTNKRFNLSGNAWPQSPLVCSRQAVAGLGMLTDHGKRDHGWEQRRQSRHDDELIIPHMLGKGRLFHDFRVYVLSNLQMPDRPSDWSDRQPQITFSLQSSRDWDRRLNFTHQIEILQSTLSPDTARLQTRTLWSMSLQEQIQTAIDSHIFVTTCGGGSITANFLPRGASLIVFYNETGGLDFDQFSSNGAPARLDWDLLGNAAHLRVHWLPIGTMDEKDDLQLFAKLVQHELRVLQACQ